MPVKYAGAFLLPDCLFMGICPYIHSLKTDNQIIVNHKESGKKITIRYQPFRASYNIQILIKMLRIVVVMKKLYESEIH